MSPFRIPIRIVFYRDPDSNCWVAHCLEFDLCGDGLEKQDAIDSLKAAIEVQAEETVRRGNWKNLFSPADGELLRMFAAGKDIAEGELKMDFHLEGVEIEGAASRESDELLTCGHDG